MRVKKSASLALLASLTFELFCEDAGTKQFTQLGLVHINRVGVFIHNAIVEKIILVIVFLLQLLEQCRSIVSRLILVWKD
jgi:hypothetical protein